MELQEAWANSKQGKVEVKAPAMPYFLSPLARHFLLK